MKAQALWIPLSVVILLVAITAIGLPVAIAGTSLPVMAYISVIQVFVTAAAAVLFRAGLRNYRQELQRAYGVFYSGIVLYSLAQLVLPLNFLTQQGYLPDITVVTSPVLLLASVSSIFLMCGGMRRFASLIQLRTAWASWWAAVGSAVAAATLLTVLLVLAGVSRPGLPPAALLALVGFNTWFSVMTLFVLQTTRMIEQVAASRYRPALRWIVAALAMMIVSDAGFIGLVLVVPLDFIQYSVIGTAIAAAAFMRAGHVYTKIATFEQDSHGASTPIDVVIFTAQLASVPRAIDVLLDPLRRVTAGLENGKTVLSARQEAQLADTYLKLEDYLVTKEPLQSFSARTLRSTIAARFETRAGSTSPFWRLFKEV